MLNYYDPRDRRKLTEGLVIAVFEQLKRETPPGIIYASFKLADGVSFVHIAAREDASSNPLTQLEAFKTFTAAIQDRCDEPPASIEMREKGFYSALAK